MKWEKKEITSFYKVSVQDIGVTGAKSGCLEPDVNPRTAECLLQGGIRIAALNPVQRIHVVKRHRHEELVQRSHSCRKRDLGQTELLVQPMFGKETTEPAIRKCLTSALFGV